MGVGCWPGTGDPASCGPAGAGRARPPGCFSAPRLRSRAEVPGPPRPTPGSRGRPESFPPSWLMSLLGPDFHFPCGDLQGFPFEGNLLYKKPIKCIWVLKGTFILFLFSSQGVTMQFSLP